MPIKKLTILLVLFIGSTFHALASNFKPSEWDKVLMEARELYDTIALNQFFTDKATAQNNNKKAIYQAFYKVLLAEYYRSEKEQQNPKIVALYTDAITLATSSGDLGIVLWTETQMGSYYYKHNELEKALNYFNKTKRILQSATTLSVPEKAWVYKRNAHFFQTIKDYATSISLLNQALQWCEKKCAEYNSILFSLGCIYLISEDFEQAEKLLQDSQRLAIQNQDELQYAKATGELGILHKKLGNNKRAEQLLIEDIEISKKIKENRNLMYARFQLGTLYLENNQTDKASEVLYKALHYAQSKEYLKGFEFDIYKLLLELALQNKNTSEEIVIRRHLDQLSQELADTESEEKVNELRWQAENAQIKWQLDSNNSKLNKAQNSIWITGLLSLAAIGVFVYLYFSNRQKMKSHVEELDELISGFQQDKLKTEDQLSQTAYSLTAYQQYLEKKNSQVEQLQKELKYLKQIKSSANLEKHKTGLEELLDSHLMTDENWDNFKRLFISEKDMVYNAIKEQLPELTESNLRIIMLQVLGLNNGQIANSLGITQDAVKKAKQRMRKKHGPHFDDLIEKYQHEEISKN